jgi:hypothetical protein
MIRLLRLTGIMVALWLCFPGGSFGQQSAARATPVASTSGRPSTFQIESNILEQQAARLQSQITIAQRCIAEASQPIVLRDPQGNVNIVPQTDVVNCTRRLVELQRQLVQLQRKSEQLSRDAQAAAITLQRKAMDIERQRRLSIGNPNQ